MRIPIFLFNGLLESGKTAFIESLLEKEVFEDGKDTLLIICEEGVEEYNVKLLEKNHVHIVNVEEEETLTESFIKELNHKYKPERVVIEYNGMWNPATLFMMKLPREWFIYESMALVNAETFNLYINNMRSIMMEHFRGADLVIFNRVKDEDNISLMRTSVKSVNNQAKLFISSPDFEMEPIKEELPFDVTADVIDISFENYGIWYIDLWDDPEKYINKQIKVSGLFFQEPSDPRDCFSFGRFAMPCCENDISLMGIYCHNIGRPRFHDKDSIEIVGQIRWENAEVYEGEGPIIYVKSIKLADKDQTDLVTFN